MGSTHRLAQDGVGGAVDATGEHGEGQGRVQAEVQERVPPLAADPDGAAETRAWGQDPTPWRGAPALPPLSLFPWEPGREAHPKDGIEGKTGGPCGIYPSCVAAGV